MKRSTLLIISIAAAGMLLFGSATATRAQSYDAAILTNNNNCLIPDGNRVIRVFKCTDGGARYNITDGRVRTSDGYCFDHGVARGMDPARSDASVKLVRCHGGASQQWYFMSSGPNKYMAQNAANTNVCMDIESGNDSPGTRLLVWNCGFSQGKANQKFYPGVTLSAQARTIMFGLIPQSAQSAINSGGGATFNNNARIVAAGAGNIVAAGAGNIVAAGAGNIVAAGAGNLAYNGTNIVSRDGAGLRGMMGGASLVGTNR
jgi:hypothetical protein